ncbi:hypothetical protein Tco_1357842 [Tanacetum coccineum]
MSHQTLSVPQNPFHLPPNSTQLMTEFPQLDSGLVVLVFTLGYDPIACLNKAMAFMSAIAASRFLSTNNQLRIFSNLRNATSSGANNVDCHDVQPTIIYNAAFQTNDLDDYDSDCDDISSPKAVLMANLSNYGSDVLSKVPNFETYQNDMDNQSVHAIQHFEQTPVDNYQDNEITSDSNIILYSQYLQETQQAVVQDTKFFANQEKRSESLTAELERYKERVKTFEQRLNIDLSSREKLIDSQMDDMIRDRLAHKLQIDSLEQNLSNQIKEKESLLQTFNVFKKESKEKKSKYMDKEINLEKKIKELDNIIYKVGQSAQTMHMLTKPQVFYDDTHKQALGYQNPFYLKNAQWIKPTLYVGSVISRQHDVIPVTDEEETLILEELNQLSKDFRKRIVPQQKLSTKQAFWLQTSHPNTDQSDISLVKIEAPRELPKVSLVNTSLQKFKYHLGKVDTVVKKRITPDAITEGSWGFEHTKAVFLNEVIPFLKTLKDIFNVFDKDLLNEITEVQTVFNQMEVVVQQCSVDKQCFEIHKKELFLDNDRLLHQIMSQDVMLTVMNSTAVFGDSENLEIKKSETCNKCLHLEVELVNKKNMVERDVYTELSNSFEKLEKNCISLELDIQLNQQIFQKDKSCENQNALEFSEYFENNDLKTQLQERAPQSTS